MNSPKLDLNILIANYLNFNVSKINCTLMIKIKTGFIKLKKYNDFYI